MLAVSKRSVGRFQNSEAYVLLALGELSGLELSAAVANTQQQHQTSSPQPQPASIWDTLDSSLLCVQKASDAVDEKMAEPASLQTVRGVANTRGMVLMIQSLELARSVDDGQCESLALLKLALQLAPSAQRPAEEASSKPARSGEGDAPEQASALAVARWLQQELQATNGEAHAQEHTDGNNHRQLSLEQDQACCANATSNGGSEDASAVAGGGGESDLALQLLWKSHSVTLTTRDALCQAAALEAIGRLLCAERSGAESRQRARAALVQSAELRERCRFAAGAARSRALAEALAEAGERGEGVH